MLTMNGTTTALSVTPEFADQWLVDLTGISSTLRFQGWFEPDAADFINEVIVDPSFPDRLLVKSDQGPGFTTGLANDTTDTFFFFLNGGELDVTFNDLGDAAAPTPDTGSTLGLLSLSVVALLGATRFRSLRLA